MKKIRKGVVLMALSVAAAASIGSSGVAASAQAAPTAAHAPVVPQAAGSVWM